MKNILLSSMFLMSSLGYVSICPMSQENYLKVDLNKPLLEQLHGLEGEERKAIIRKWCGKFDRHLKRIKKEESLPFSKADTLINTMPKGKCAKKIKFGIEDFERIEDLNNKDNNEYLHTLAMLETTKSIIKAQFEDVYQNHVEVMQTLKKEIALFEDEDGVIFDPEHLVNKNKKTKVKLTQRDVFTRSRVPLVNVNDELKKLKELEIKYVPCVASPENRTQVSEKIFDEFVTLDKPLLEQLNGLAGEDRKQVIKKWCDEFKSNLKTIKKEPRMMEDEDVLGDIFPQQIAERLAAAIDKKKEEYAKKIKPVFTDFERRKYLNDTEEYIDTLVMLMATRAMIRVELGPGYARYKKSIQALKEEIALFEDQDKVVSPAKTVNSSSYFKPQLTHREVFSRSNMSSSDFEQVKAARE